MLGITKTNLSSRALSSHCAMLCCATLCSPVYPSSLKIQIPSYILHFYQSFRRYFLFSRCTLHILSPTACTGSSSPPAMQDRSTSHLSAHHRRLTLSLRPHRPILLLLINTPTSPRNTAIPTPTHTTSMAYRHTLSWSHRSSHPTIFLLLFS